MPSYKRFISVGCNFESDKFIYLSLLSQDIESLWIFFLDKIFNLNFFTMQGWNTSGKLQSFYLKFSTSNKIMGKSSETSNEMLCIFYFNNYCLIKWISVTNFFHIGVFKIWAMSLNESFSYHTVNLNFFYKYQIVNFIIKYILTNQSLTNHNCRSLWKHLILMFL